MIITVVVVVISLQTEKRTFLLQVRCQLQFSLFELSFSVRFHPRSSDCAIVTQLSYHSIF